MPKMEEFKQRISTLFRDTEGNNKRIHEITKSINNCLWEVENKGGGQKSRTRIWGVCACVCLHKSSNIWLSKPFENVIFIFFTWNLKQKLIKILNRKIACRVLVWVYLWGGGPPGREEIMFILTRTIHVSQVPPNSSRNIYEQIHYSILFATCKSKSAH